MPILSMFYGIIIRMYYADNKQHHVLGNDRAVFSIADEKLLAGNFPKNKTHLYWHGSKSDVKNRMQTGS